VEESAAASSSSIWLSAPNDRTWRRNRASSRPLSGSGCGVPAAPTSCSGSEVLGHLDEGERVPLGLRHDAQGDITVEREPRFAGEELEGGRVIQATDLRNGEVVEEVVALRPAPFAEDERDAVRLQAAAPEGERLERLAVDPLGVVDDREQPLTRPRRVGGEAHRAETHEEGVGRRSCRQPQRRVHRVALVLRKTFDLMEDRNEQAVQGRVPEVTLRFEAGKADDEEVGRPVDGVVEQGGLPDAGITPDDERAAQPAAHRRE
jgi:hypothetical protein